MYTILNELSKKDFLSLQELIDNIGCSASTIRRDLSKLQQLGKLTRLHGLLISSYFHINGLVFYLVTLRKFSIFAF